MPPGTRRGRIPDERGAPPAARVHHRVAGRWGQERCSMSVRIFAERSGGVTCSCARPAWSASSRYLVCSAKLTPGAGRDTRIRGEPAAAGAQASWEGPRRGAAAIRAPHSVPSAAKEITPAPRHRLEQRFEFRPRACPRPFPHVLARLRRHRERAPLARSRERPAGAPSALARLDQGPRLAVPQHLARAAGPTRRWAVPTPWYSNSFSGDVWPPTRGLACSADQPSACRRQAGDARRLHLPGERDPARSGGGRQRADAIEIRLARESRRR